MPRNLYEPNKLLARAREWRIEAAAATSPEMRDFCLSEAARCERIVRQSLETPAVGDGGPASTRARRRAPQPAPACYPDPSIRAATDRR